MPDVVLDSNGAGNIALPWFDAGCSTIPIRPDGKKAPFFKWDKYQIMPPLRSEVRTWFEQRYPACGVALICGKVSGNLELLELEGRASDGQSLSQVVEQCALRGIDWLWDQLLHQGYAEWTPSGGLHLLYRIPEHEIPGNTKLASRYAYEHEFTDEEKHLFELNPARKFVRTKAETRGEGGYVVVAPTGGQCHETGEPWTVVGGAIGVIPTITWEQRMALHAAVAAALDEMPPPEPAPRREIVPREVGLPLRPGDDFNVRGDWEDPWFTREGWKVSHRSANETFWTRPGKERGQGHSASTGYKDGADRLYVWSTSAGLPTEQPLNKFFVYAFYHHGGDMVAAAKDLSAQGYGDRRPRSAELEPWTPTGRSLEASDAQLVPDDAVDLTAPELTDLGNGRRMNLFAGDRFHYVPKQKKWRQWNGTAWSIDDGMIALRQEINRMNDELLMQCRANGDQKLVKHAEKSQSTERTMAAAKMFETVPGIAVSPDVFDADQTFVNVQNGVLNLSTGELVPHDPKYMLTKTLGASYVPDATAPRWQQYLNEVLPDADMQDFVQRMAGYTLMGNPVERALAVLHGPGGTGKSRFIETLNNIFGEYSTTAAESLFRSKRDASSGPTNDLHDLRGARMASVTELDSGVRMDEALVKRLTGFDRITSRGLYEENQTWMPKCVIWLATNHHFDTNSDDGAIFDRLKIITFNQKIEKRDPNLLDKLLEERNGILNWILEGLQKYHERGLEMPDGVQNALDEYRSEQDNVRQYRDDSVAEGILVEDEAAEVEKGLLYQNYVGWCKNNMINRPLGQMRFARRFRTLGYEEFKRSKMFWKGVTISQHSFKAGMW